jgi:hypothetical protein
MDGPVEGFAIPVHRALTEPILLGGAPRSFAIVNGTLAAALGLGLRLWIAGLLSGPSAMPPQSGPQSAIRSLWRPQGVICASPPTSTCE